MRRIFSARRLAPLAGDLPGSFAWGQLALACLCACGNSPPVEPPVPGPEVLEAAVQRFAFGSCLNQNGDLAILQAVSATRPEFLLMLGDNVYADATEVYDLQMAYGTLAGRPEFISLVSEVPLLATWDDHDYGLNDSGRENPLKLESKGIMLDFFGEPPGSPRRQREGNYDAVMLGPPGFEVQLILLDTRWFRDPVDQGEMPGAVLLGDAQWSWLEAELAKPAAFRVLVSSIQVIHAAHPYETWGNFPHERARLAELLARMNAQPLVILSGDRHHTELSCARLPGLEDPIYEFTASSFNRPSDLRESNPWRVPGMPVVSVGNFGLASFDWSARKLTLSSLTSDATAWTTTLAFSNPSESVTCEDFEPETR